MSWKIYECNDIYKQNYISHPAKIVESKNLAATPSPMIDYQPSFSEQLKSNGNLSSFQQETIARICQSLQTCGAFLLADGTGTGKGRVLAGCALEYCIKNPESRIIWVSVNKRLFQDAKRDIDSLQPDSNHLEWSHFENSNLCFLSYHDFTKEETVIELLKWINPASKSIKNLIMFDEAHCLRHACNISEKTLQCIDKLSKDVHFLYSTATPASIPSHLRFTRRLGLWGKSSSFFNFNDFQSSLSKYGTTAMELTAMQLKSSGKFVSRQIDTQDIQVEIHKHDLTIEERNLYDNFTDILRDNQECGGPLHQLFFQRILASFKISTVIKLIKEGLDQGFSVIVSMQTTGQASDDRNINPDEPEFISSAWDIFQRLTQTNIEKNMFPKDALDAILEEFGADNIAEITGRSRRVTKNGDEIVFGQRPNSLKECEDFQSGKKRIALISKAGSTGISLHDQNDRPRLQICLELPWSSEDFMQQCGRTHRSNSTSTPKYIFVHTNVPAELRFASSISEKLKTMGALSRGDRDTSSVYKIDKDIKVWNTHVKRDVALRILFHVIWRHINYISLKKYDFFTAYTILRINNIHTNPSIVHLNCWKIMLLVLERKNKLTQNLAFEEEEGIPELKSDFDILSAIYSVIPQVHYWIGLNWSNEKHMNFSLKTQKIIETIHLIRSYPGNFLTNLPQEIFENICIRVAKNDFEDCADLYRSIRDQQIDFTKFPTIIPNMIQNRALGMSIDDQKQLFTLFTTSCDKYSKEKSGVFPIVEYILRNVKTSALNVTCKNVIFEKNGIVSIYTKGSVDTSLHSNNGEFYVFFSGKNVIRTVFTHTFVLLFQPYERQPFRKFSIDQWQEEIDTGRYIKSTQNAWENESLGKLKRLRRQAMNLNKVFTLSTLNAIDKWSESCKVILHISPPFFHDNFSGLLLHSSTYF